MAPKVRHTVPPMIVAAPPMRAKAVAKQPEMAVAVIALPELIKANVVVIPSSMLVIVNPNAALILLKLTEKIDSRIRQLAPTPAFNNIVPVNMAAMVAINISEISRPVL